jgi:HK97 family phage prohead protease
MNQRVTLYGTITAADAGARTIAGRIVTWNEVGNTSAGKTKFAPGAINASNGVVLRLEHNRTSPLGRSTSLTAHEEGIDGVFRIVQTTAGNDALVEAAEGLRPGFSVGVILKDYEYGEDGTLIVTAADLEEVSLVTEPAIASATVTKVAAQHSEENIVSETTPEIAEVEEVAEVEAVDTVEASRPSHLSRTSAVPRQQFRDPADYIHAFVSASTGNREAALRISAANQTLADNPGIVPTPIIGNVVTFLQQSRPIVTRSRSVGMPSAGATFIRPKVTAHSVAGKQLKELDPLASGTMKVTPISVSKETYGGSLKITMQDAAWTDPAILNLAVTDIASMYGVQTDAAAGAKLIAAAKKTVPLAADADAKATIAAIINASQQIAAAIYKMPDTIFCSFDQWARLAATVDTTGRQLFPFGHGMNDAGGPGRADNMSMNVLGLDVVADANLPSGSLIVGHSQELETYETIGGQLSIQNPTTLSFDIAYYGFFAATSVEDNAFITLKPGA